MGNVIIETPGSIERSRQEVLDEVGAMMQAYGSGLPGRRYATPEDCVRLRAALARRGIIADVMIGLDRKFRLRVTSYTSRPPIDMVRRKLLSALEDGTLGVIAATYDVAEKSLRDFAAGDDESISPEIFAELFQAIATKGRLSR